MTAFQLGSGRPGVEWLGCVGNEEGMGDCESLGAVVVGACF